MFNTPLGYLVPNQDATTACAKAPIQHKNPVGLQENCVYRVTPSQLPDQMPPVLLLPA